MNKPDVLIRIAASVEKKLNIRKAALPYEKLLLEVNTSRRPSDFTARLRDGVQIIAEVKFRSPSQSESAHASTVENAVKVAGAYLACGASALSILTEEDHFNGSPKYLQAIRKAYPQSYLLMKDFIIDDYQLYEAVVQGADCILLIVALLDEEKLRSLYARARELGLSVLVEVHNEEEMAVALGLNASLIGINNRNLKDLSISLDTSRRLAAVPPKAAVLVCESGIEKASEILEMSHLGFTGFLIGTSLMRTNDPGASLARLLTEVSK